MRARREVDNGAFPVETRRPRIRRPLRSASGIRGRALLPMHHADRPNGFSTSGRFGVRVVQTVQADQPKRHSFVKPRKGRRRVQIPGDIADRQSAHSGPLGPGGQTCQTPRNPRSQWLQAGEAGRKTPPGRDQIDPPRSGRG